MTEEERLAKNNRIREQGKLTRQKRKSQVCRVYRVKIDVSHLSRQQLLHLKMLFVEAKWLYNDALTFMHDNDINEYDSKTLTVHGLDKDMQQVTHELQYLVSQMRQSVIQIEGANQFWNIPSLEFANAKLLNLPDGYYIAITNFQEKGEKEKKYKPEIGIDMGIKTSITTSDGRKINVQVEESERLKKCQRLIARRKKGSSNRYKAVKLLRKEYQKLGSSKRDTANKIVHELLEHERVYMQDENLRGWHKGLFGRTVQHSVLGLVKARLMKSEQVTVLPKSVPTTKYCPNCGSLKKDITLSDRVYECSCGYHEDRDIHAARNMILLSRQTTCGTQESNAFGEDVRHSQSKGLSAGLVELGSSSLYKGRSSSH